MVELKDYTGTSGQEWIQILVYNAELHQFRKMTLFKE